MLDWWGIGLVPWITLGMLAMVLFACMRMDESPHEQVSHASPSALALLKQREVIAFFASSFLMIAAHASLYVYYSLYLAQIGYSNSLIGLMWSIGVIAEIVFFFYQAPIFHRFGIRSMLVTSLLIAVGRFLMIGFGAESVAVLVVAQVLHAATFGVHHSASVATMQRWFSGPLQARGQALFISISYGLGGTFGGLLLSGLWDTFGPQAIYSMAAALSLAATGAALLSYRWQAHHQEGK